MLVVCTNSRPAKPEMKLKTHLDNFSASSSSSRGCERLRGKLLLQCIRKPDQLTAPWPPTKQHTPWPSIQHSTHLSLHPLPKHTLRYAVSILLHNGCVCKPLPHPPSTHQHKENPIPQTPTSPHIFI